MLIDLTTFKVKQNYSTRARKDLDHYHDRATLYLTPKPNQLFLLYKY